MNNATYKCLSLVQSMFDKGLISTASKQHLEKWLLSEHLETDQNLPFFDLDTIVYGGDYLMTNKGELIKENKPEQNKDL